MIFTWLFVFPVSMAVLFIIERRDRKRDERRAREDRLVTDRIDRLDRLADRMLADDPWAETDRLWLAEYDVAWDFPLPSRPARHSPNRLHRVF